MKILYKLVIISFLFIIGHAENSFHKQYVKELLEYKTKLPNNLCNPFIVKYRSVKKVKKTKTKRTKIKNNNKTKKIKRFVFREKRLLLMAILNDKVLVKLPELNKVKWLKVGEKVDDYVLRKIVNDSTILVSIKNKTKIIKMKHNNVRIKVRK